MIGSDGACRGNRIEVSKVAAHYHVRTVREVVGDVGARTVEGIDTAPPRPRSFQQGPVETLRSSESPLSMIPLVLWRADHVHA